MNYIKRLSNIFLNIRLGSIQYRTFCSDPYDEYKAPSPYKLPLRGRRFGLKVNHHQDGDPLPKPDEDHELRMKPYKYHPRAIRELRVDHWTKKRMLFGQNDYIDILGDGTIEPYQLMKGPVWLRGFGGNWMQHLVRRRTYQEYVLKEYYPTKQHELKKELDFQYKRLNHKRRPWHRFR